MNPAHYLWAHGAVALLFAVLGAWRLRRGGALLATAYAATAFWTGAVAWGWLAGLGLAASVPLLAIGRKPGPGRVRLSRAAVFQSLSLLAICAYFLLMAAVTGAGEPVGWHWSEGLKLVGLAMTTAAAVVLIPSGPARAWLRITLTKHLFRHRYDYRVEWLRFTDALGSAGAARAPLPDRVLGAIAEMVEAGGGILYVPGAGGGLELAASSGWGGASVNGADLDILSRQLEASGRIVDFAALRAGKVDAGAPGLAFPEWMLADRAIWAGVPLVHEGSLAGLVLLGAPPVARLLDWEDFDLLRTAGRQAASYLAESRGQDALHEARRFDEFNRRFAFILHDIKNLVSGLALVARNAERHADNPEFRADMVLTLQSSVEKMKMLLARLSAQESARGEEVRPMLLGPLLRQLVAAKRRRHDVRLMGDAELRICSDPARLEAALGHLIDNAIDASPADAPVLVNVSASDGGARVAVVDRGPGMSASFLRDELFKPFASTKAGGFGLGAHEARSLVGLLGGTLRVESEPGRGTRFLVFLPPAPALKEAA